MSQQRDLFDSEPQRKTTQNFLDLPGLTYCAGFLDAAKQTHILSEVDARPWLNDLKRRVQHYGYRYDYTAREVNHSMFVGPLPEFAVEVARSLLALKLVDDLPDQLIVNEYTPGQGIAAHVDCLPCFQNTIVTISLGSVYEMDFINLETKEVRSALLELGSALVMCDEARFDWAHRIQARKSDHNVPRGRRVSLTFRNVILND